MMPTFCLGGTFASFWLNFTPKTGKRPFCTKHTTISIKNNEKDDVCQFWGPQNVGKRHFLATFVLRMFFSHISFGLPRPLRTAFELNNCTAYSKKSAGCDCAN